MSSSLNLVSSSMIWLYNRLWFSDVAIAVSSFFIVSCMLERLTNKGPMQWPVMGITPTLFLHMNKAHDWLTGALICAGGTFPYRGIWMGGCHGFITADPSKIEHILKTNFKNYPKGKYYKERFNDLLGDGIFNADGELWKEQRRAAISEMNSNRFMEYSTVVVRDLVHRKLLKLMKECCSSKSRVDLQEVLLRFTFDNICLTAFGVDPGCLSLNLPEISFAKSFEEATELTLFRFMLPPFVWKPLKLMGLGFEKRLKEAVRAVHDFAEKTVKQRRSESCEQRSDLLSRLIGNEKESKKNFFSDELLKDFCISFILAGRDTSSVGLAWFFWLIYKNPEIEAKILCEIREIIACREPKPEDENNVVFTEEELKKMVYLQAAISESLRLYPPVPIDFKEAQEDDNFADGTVVKRGDRILYSIYSMGRMESIWGEDCRKFRPERWIKGGELVSESQFRYAAFNGGPRLCVGKKLAYVQMKMVAASVMLRYRVKVVEGHEVVPKLTTTLYMKHGLLVTLEPRLTLIT